ncbi:MAG: hypothetical protein CL915_10775 [Deltaproteobacteria bacterium]|nr:hypothetical protein [Deltaproteobacteria bacterium]
MDVDGCVGAQGTRGAQKQGKKGTFRAKQALIWALWPGKFPRTSCFVMVWRIWVCMGVGGCIWVLRGTLWSRGTGGTKNNRETSKTG